MKKFLFVVTTVAWMNTCVVFGQNQDALLNVFVDCRTYCDITYFKQEINFINYARDQALADVHLLIMAYPMASGGTRYDMSFIGKKSFDGQDQELSFEAPPQTNSDERRKGMAKKIKLGLTPFLMQTDLANQISINVNHNEQNNSTEANNNEDPWKQWVFELGANGNMNLEKSRRDFNWRTWGEMDRVTENWRINQDFYYNIKTTYFEDEEDVIRGKRERYGIYGRIVKSIDNHWSAGIFDSYVYSTFDNINAGVSLGPALEYSIFPYKEVTFREITIAYYNRFYYRDYIEPTIYGEEEETLWDQSIRLTARFRRPWGSLFSSLQGRHFFHDLSKNSLAFNNRVSLQVIKGLNFNVTTNFEFVNDQLNLPAGDASIEDILLQQRQLSTNYEFYFALGVSYTFGSIYNNIINTRL